MPEGQLTLRAYHVLSAVVLILVVSAVLAVDGYDLTWFTVDGGGATIISGEGYTLSGCIGQPDAGLMSRGDYILVGGFWGRPAPNYASYLPIVRR